MSQIAVKGDQDGLLIILPEEGENSDVFEIFEAHLEQSGTFFKGAAVTLDVGARSLEQAELERYRELLQAWEVRLHALRGSDDGTRTAAIELGLELPYVASGGAARRGHSLTEIPEESVEALLVRRNLRSGQAVRHPGAVIVMGDVNAGAEIVAGGDVLVWGALRGVVHAGAMGDERAVVCALKLSPTQLRISQYITISPESQEKPRPRLWHRSQQRPELARIQDDTIVVEAWNGRLPT